MHSFLRDTREARLAAAVLEIGQQSEDPKKLGEIELKGYWALLE